MLSHGRVRYPRRSYLVDIDQEYEPPWESEALEEFENAKRLAFPSGESLPIIETSQRKGDPNYDPNAGKMPSTPVVDTSAPHKTKLLSRSFTVADLAHSGGVHFERARIDPELVRCLQKIRDRVGKSIKINSGYRSWRHNQRLVARCKKRLAEGHSCTVSEVSQHLSGRAVDVQVAGMTGPQLAQAALEACGNRISLGIGRTYIHFDVRPGPPQTWGYGSQAETLKRRGLAMREQLAASGGTPAPRPSPSPASSASPSSDGGLLGTVSSAFAGVKDALRRGMWGTALAAAIVGGQRDVNKLTNLVFFARHPELQGRKIRKGERTLARQWVLIRDKLVKPALARVPAGVLSGAVGAPVVTSRAVLPFSGELPQQLARLGYNLKPRSSVDALQQALLEFQRDVRIQLTGRVDDATSTALDRLNVKLDAHVDKLKTMRHLSRFRLTRYHVVDEADFDGNRIVPVLDSNGNVLALVDPLFFLHMSVEGTGRIGSREGRSPRLLKVSGKNVDVSGHPAYQTVLEKGRSHFRSRITEKGIGATGVRLRDGRVTEVHAFHFPPRSRYGIGYGIQRGIPYDPFRTLAADIGIRRMPHDPNFKGKGGLVPPKTRVFILGLAGKRLPDGTVHDGWCTVNDTGGAIFGAHFDVFTGSKELGRLVNLPHISHVWFDGSEERCPPSYTYGLRRR